MEALVEAVLKKVPMESIIDYKAPQAVEATVSYRGQNMNGLRRVRVFVRGGVGEEQYLWCEDHFADQEIPFHRLTTSAGWVHPDPATEVARVANALAVATPGATLSMTPDVQAKYEVIQEKVRALFPSGNHGWF